MSISDKNKINNNINKICMCLDLLNNNIYKIDKKISDISELYYNLNMNTSLPVKETYTYLNFQINLLKVERFYYNSLVENIKNKFVKDIYMISESILMLLCSIENINFQDNSEKEEVLKHISSLKPYKSNLETSEILEIVTSSLHNLDIINKFIIIFNEYIKETMLKNKRDNFHCNNLKLILESKKEHITLEYNKFYNKINELVNYFSKMTKELEEQLKNQKLLNFLANKVEDK